MTIKKLLQHIFIYKTNDYGQPKYFTWKINKNGIKHLIKLIWNNLIKFIFWIIKIILQFLIPTIIAYFLFKKQWLQI